MDKNKIGYIWYCLNVIESLYYSENFELKAIFVPKSRITSLISLFADSRNIDLYIVEDAEELHNALVKYEKSISCCLMYDCGIIVKKKTIDIIDIFNIHPGDLHTNRWNNPLEYSLINNDEYITISLHKISEKIDMWLLIYTLKIPLLIRDTLDSIEIKIYDHIDQIIKKLYEFISNEDTKTEKILYWTYNKKISNNLIIIDIQKDNPIDIYNKIRWTGFHLKNNDHYSEIKPLNEQFRPRYNKGVNLSVDKDLFVVTHIVRIELDLSIKETKIYKGKDTTIIIEKNCYRFILNVDTGLN